VRVSSEHHPQEWNGVSYAIHCSRRESSLCRVQIYHTYTHIYIYTHAYTHVHTYTHIDIYTWTHAHAHKYTHAKTQTNQCTQISMYGHRTHTKLPTHSLTHPPTHLTHPHTSMHASSYINTRGVRIKKVVGARRRRCFCRVLVGIGCLRAVVHRCLNCHYASERLFYIGFILYVKCVYIYTCVYIHLCMCIFNTYIYTIYIYYTLYIGCLRAVVHRSLPATLSLCARTAALYWLYILYGVCMSLYHDS